MMVECASYLSARGHEVHAFASEWDEHVLPNEVLRHQIPTMGLGRSPLLHPWFSCAWTTTLRRMVPPMDVVAGFGVDSAPGSVVWMTSVHAAWLETSKRYRNFLGRTKQRLNLFHPIILTMEKRLIKLGRYRKLICLSQNEKEHLMRIYGAPQDKIAVLPNGFDEKEFNVAHATSKRKSMRDTLGYKEVDRVVIFVANEAERKGLPTLLRALSATHVPNVRLLVVGRLSESRYIPEIQSLGLSQRVHFVGATNQVADFFVAADVFCLPTRYEAWGLVIVEALACGVPVVTSRLAGASTAVRENETGYLLDDPGDVTELTRKLDLVLSGQSWAPHVISESVRKYRWSNILEEYEAILGECAVSRSS